LGWHGFEFVNEENPENCPKFIVILSAQWELELSF